MRVAELAPAPYNPRRISGEAMAGLEKSIERFGLVQPIVWNKRTGHVCGGHQRVAALIKAGHQEAQVVVIDLPEAEEMALNIALNSPTIAGEFTDDLQALLDQLHSALPDYVDDFNLNELWNGSAFAQSEERDEDAVPSIPKNPTTKPGDIWTMGNHVLICGDCRDWQLVKNQISSPIHLVVTSPPYASQRKYDESSGFKPIPPEQYVEWFSGVQDAIRKLIADDGSYFLNIKEHCEEGERHLYVKDLVISHVREWGWRWVDEFAWVHGGTPKAVVNRFKNGWEPIFQFSKSQKFKFRPDAVRHESESIPDWGGRHPSQNDSHGLRGDGGIGGAQGKGLPRGGIFGGVDVGTNDGLAYPSNALSLGKNREALGHGAAYPVALPEFFIKAYTDKDDLVFDPFMGSGSTIIACEKNGRRSIGTEISQAYCDVIVNRWQDFTGKKAERIPLTSKKKNA